MITVQNNCAKIEIGPLLSERPVLLDDISLGAGSASGDHVVIADNDQPLIDCHVLWRLINREAPKTIGDDDIADGVGLLLAESHECITDPFRKPDVAIPRR